MHKVIFNVIFYLYPSGGTRGYARKTVELPFVPTTDTYLECLAWKDARKPKSVSYNIDESYFYVDFGADNLDSESSIKTNKEMYASHEWEIS